MSNNNSITSNTHAHHVSESIGDDSNDFNDNNINATMKHDESRSDNQNTCNNNQCERDKRSNKYNAKGNVHFNQ